VLFIYLLSALFATANAAKRVALVIGNSAYEKATPLINPKNDAADITVKLKSLGFEVVTGIDVGHRAMRRTVEKYLEALVDAEIAVFFYAGHALQVNGQNYLVPVDAELKSHLDLNFETIPVSFVMSNMEQLVKTNLVFLDACRDNPLAKNLKRSMGTRSALVAQGLASIGTGVGTLVAYATEPGNVALDGKGRNSPYTAALLKHLGTPGEGIIRNLVSVRNDVLAATKGKQVPWEHSSLTGEIVLKRALQPVPAKPEPEAVAQKPNPTVELAYWNSIESANKRVYYETYMKRYPKGLFKDIAQLKIAELGEKVVDGSKVEKPVGVTQIDENAASKIATDAAILKDKENKATERIAETARLAAAAKKQAAIEVEKIAAEKLATQEAERLRIAQEASREKEALRAAEEQRRAEVEQREAEIAAEKDAAKQAAFEASTNKIAALKIARDKLAKEKAERQAAELLAVEQAKLTNNTEPNDGDEKIVVAKLDTGSNIDTSPTAEVEESGQLEVPLSKRELARALQTELNRLGCSVGKIDGIWGRGSRRALKAFENHGEAKFVSLVPSQEILIELKVRSGRVCPCRNGFELIEGQCERVKRSASVDPQIPAKAKTKAIKPRKRAKKAKPVRNKNIKRKSKKPVKSRTKKSVIKRATARAKTRWCYRCPQTSNNAAQTRCFKRNQGSVQVDGRFCKAI